MFAIALDAIAATPEPEVTSLSGPPQSGIVLALRDKEGKKQALPTKPSRKTTTETLPAPPAPEIALISPEPGSIVKEANPTFRWQVSGLSGGQKVSYSLRVVEVLPEQSLQDALGKNPPALEQKNLTDTSFQVPGKAGLASEKVYAVQVAAVGPGGAELSRTGVSVFGVGWSFNFCFLIPNPSVDYCIGQTSGLNVAWAIMTGSGSLSWTLAPANTADLPVSGSSAVITIPPTSLPTTPGSHTYTLTVTKAGNCTRTAQITITAHQAPTGGNAGISAALHFTDLPSWTQSVKICCGTGLKLKVDPPIVGSIQWEQSTNNGITWTAVSGATGTPYNINSQQLPPCNQNQSIAIWYRARISTTPPCADFISNTVDAVIYPPPQGTVTAVPSAICIGSPVTITLSGNQPGTTWTWTPILPQAPANTVSFTDVPAATTTYQATVQWPVVISPSGTCQPVTPSVTVTVDQKPVAGTITASPPIICPGDDSVITLTGSSGVVQWYSSTNPNSITFFTPPNQIAGALGNTTQNSNILNITTYFGVQVSSPNGVCPAVYSAIVPVTVNQPPSAPIITGSHVICIGGSVTLTAPPLPTGLTYQWYCNGAPCGILNSQTLVVTEPGNYWVEIGWSALNPNGSAKACGTVKSNIITIQADLLAVNITGPCCPCKGQKIQLCANPINGTGPFHYQWSSNAGSSTAKCTLVIPNATTTYTVTVTDSNGCHATTSFIVTVCP